MLIYKSSIQTNLSLIHKISLHFIGPITWFAHGGATPVACLGQE